MAEFTDQDIIDLISSDSSTDAGDYGSPEGRGAPGTSEETPGYTSTGLTTTGAAPIFGESGVAQTPESGIPAALQESGAFERMSGAFQSGNIDKYILPGGGFNWELMEQDAQEMRASLNWSNTLFDKLVVPVLVGVMSMGFGSVISPMLAAAGAAPGAAASMANTLASTAINGILTGKVDLKSLASSLISSNVTIPLTNNIIGNIESGMAQITGNPDFFFDAKQTRVLTGAIGSALSTAIKGGGSIQDLKNGIAGAVNAEMNNLGFPDYLSKAIGTYVSTGDLAKAVEAGVVKAVSAPSPAPAPAPSPAPDAEPAPAPSPSEAPSPAPAPEPAPPPTAEEAMTQLIQQEQAAAPSVEPAPEPKPEPAAPDEVAKPAEPPKPEEVAKPAEVAEVAKPAEPVTLPQVEITGALPAQDQAMLDLISSQVQKPVIAQETVPPAPPAAVAEAPKPVPEAAAPTPEPAPAPVPEPQRVEIVAPQAPAVDQEIIDLLARQFPEMVGTPTPPVPEETTPPAPQEIPVSEPAAPQQVEVTAPAQTVTDQEIIDLIAPSAPQAPTAPVEAPPPQIVVEAPAPEVQRVEVTAPAPVPVEEVFDEVAPKPEEAQPAAPTPPEPEATQPLTPTVQQVEVTGKAPQDQEIIDFIEPVAPEQPPVPPLAPIEPAPAPPAAEEAPAPQQVTVTGERGITDQDIIDLIQPPEVAPLPLPEIPSAVPEDKRVEVTGKKLEEEPIDTVVPEIRGEAEEKPKEPAAAPAPAPAAATTKTTTEEPTDIFSYVPAKPRAAPSLAQLVTMRQYPTTGVTQGLGPRAPGEIESEVTGKKRRNVWNEASLRLKDALGL